MTNILQQRAIIESVWPEIDGGRYAIKRTVDESVVVEAVVFADGHDALSCVLLYRKSTATRWSEVPMSFIGGDRWRAEFTVTDIGEYVYTVRAWIDRFKSWHRDLQKRVAAGQDVGIDLLIGAELLEAASRRAGEPAAGRLQSVARRLRADEDQAEKLRLILDDDLYQLVLDYPDTQYAVTYDKALRVTVDRERARFSSWYELFPRSCAARPGQHGTFRDCARRLRYIAAMGFDVVYLPPIHPIGQSFRKGKNNAISAQPDDVGSPWAIGSAEGGHKAIHPDLGTLEDFRFFVRKAREYGMEIALDLAFQCSPDHPYVKEHPEWFHHRPDGTIQYAENPPKKYQDIYPINFETPNAKELWEELKSVILYWVEQGVFIFRVDNPHTKSFYFWEWVIKQVRQKFPEVLFLAEAFTRPRLMENLAKLGFSQSYTYFTWRNSKWELIEYLTELTQTPVREFFRPNFWPNTPDILHAYLQTGGRAAFKIRLVLAATMTANYGIYGPVFELCHNVPREPGSEEYLHSEKYQLQHWNLDAPASLRELIALINYIRRENEALQHDWNLRFHSTDNDQIICYSKHTPDYRNRILVVVSLDPFHKQAGWVGVDMKALGLNQQRPYIVHDLLSGASYSWRASEGNYVELRPYELPAHIFRIEQS